MVDKILEVNGMPVKLRVLGVQKKDDIDYKKGMKVADVLDAAKVAHPEDATITVDAKVATLETKVDDNALIVVTPNIRNG